MPEAERRETGGRHSPLLRPDGILFDMDGVLIDSRHAWYGALAAVFKARLERDLGEAEFMQRYWARDLRDIFQELHLEIDIQGFCRETFPAYTDRVRLFPDTLRVLELLAAYPKAIITNTPPECTSQILARLDLQRHFAAVVTGFEVKRSKPAPDIVYKACLALGLPAGETMVVGDSSLDVRAGRAAGSLVVGVGIEADYTIHDLSGLLELVACD